MLGSRHFEEEEEGAAVWFSDASFMATTKRAYKLLLTRVNLEEFVAHSSNVNCLKIGRKTSRVLVTGGDDNKVNIWAIGKPNAIMSLSGHMSAVESVSFDSSEVLVAAGAASGSIKLWDLEEAKIVRTLTGHRSNCIAVDFHPFGEFFASGSLDTNLKIWDIRRKGCIHTYKGHTRGVNAIKFTPDGRWVVSGGEDNIVKLWDLTAGKLLHDFKLHEGQIQCIDFHPHEFLLATGSADRTVKFWDLETFELIGSAGPERIEPYAIASAVVTNGHSESKSTSSGNLSLQADDNIKSSMGRLSISQSSEPNSKETKQVASAVVPGTPQRIATSASQKATTITTAPVVTSVKRSSSKAQATTNLPTINKSEIIPVVVPRTSPRFELSSDSTKSTGVGRTVPYDIQSKFANFQKVSNIRDDSDKADMSVQSVGTEHNELLEQTAISSCNAVTQPVIAGENNLNDIKRVRTRRLGANLFRESSANYDQENYSIRVHKPKEACSFDVPKGGRTKSLVANWERRERSPTYDGPRLSSSSETMADANSYSLRGHNQIAEKEIVPASDEDAISFVLEKHDQFLNVAQSRLTKLRIVYRLWERNDIKGVISAIEKMSDHAVSADVLSSLMDKSDVITLDICPALLPLLTSLLERHPSPLSTFGKADSFKYFMPQDQALSLRMRKLIVITSLAVSLHCRHLGISLEMLLKLVRIFGPVISSTLSAGPSVGVDLQAEQRLERCNLCFIELEKVKHRISLLIRPLASPLQANHWAHTMGLTDLGAEAALKHSNCDLTSMQLAKSESILQRVKRVYLPKQYKKFHNTSRESTGTQLLCHRESGLCCPLQRLAAYEVEKAKRSARFVGCKSCAR
ncbi:katanin p80 WD40 repeat-containing subunit B1 [Musa troglodytarum]|uniref:Katanin p80 WD40 repeat-containing subunit B1 homolog n=1 Tax=Musa troglodytarum TaxID=320322 RepID=A0A9E7HHN9_9LILI|nr:katanin p80 WD40 repeat-containing subunit B1 [Musa troglodytarum]